MELELKDDKPEDHAAIQRDPDRLGEMGRKELHVLQPEEVWSPAPGRKQCQAPINSGGHAAANQLHRKDTEDPGGHQVSHQPTMYPYHNKKWKISWAALK